MTASSWSASTLTRVAPRDYGLTEDRRYFGRVNERESTRRDDVTAVSDLP